MHAENDELKAWITRARKREAFVAVLKRQLAMMTDTDEMSELHMELREAVRLWQHACSEVQRLQVIFEEEMAA